VLGDLMLDVVLAADRSPESGTDVPGRVEIRQGGSAANTARWLGRLGVATQLVCSIGRDGAGRSLVI
jgi:ribokinase